MHRGKESCTRILLTYSVQEKGASGYVKRDREETALLYDSGRKPAGPTILIVKLQCEAQATN